jgi:hypothetical protein
MLGFNPFDLSGVDSENSESRRSLISALWSLTITASTFGFEKLSTALHGR